MKRIVKSQWKPRAVIPADVDPIELADIIKGDMTTEWLKRKEMLKANPKSDVRIIPG